MNKLIPFNQITIGFYYVLMFSPFISYIYSVLLNLPKTIIHLYIFFCFGFGLLFVLLRKKINIPKYYWLFFVYSIYRLIWFIKVGGEYHYITRFYYGITNFSTFLLLVLIFNTNINKLFINKSIKFIEFITFIGLIVSFIQVFNYNFYNAFEFYGISNYSGGLYNARRTSIFGFVDLNELGLSFLPLLSVLIGYKLIHRIKNYSIYLLMGGLICILSNNRYVIVGFIILTIQVLWARKIRISNILNYILMSLVVVLIIFQVLKTFNYNFEQWFESRLFAEGSLQETTRYKAFSTFLFFFPQKMVWGTGVHLTDEIREVSASIGSSQIHVGYLSHLVSYGLVGSFLLFGFWFFLLKDLHHSAKETQYWGSFYAFLIYFWAQAILVNYSIFFTGLIYALIFKKYYDQINLKKVYNSSKVTQQKISNDY